MSFFFYFVTHDLLMCKYERLREIKETKYYLKPVFAKWD